MKTVIIINGQGGVGKNYICDIAALKYKIDIISAAALPKKLASECGWNGIDKDEKTRKFLSDLLVAIREYNEGCNKYLINETKKFADTENDILFIHVREPKDIRYIYDGIKNIPNIKVKTLLILSPEGKKKYGNVGDDSVFDYDYDYNYVNDKLICYEKSKVNIMNLIDNIVSGSYVYERMNA